MNLILLVLQFAEAQFSRGRQTNHIRPIELDFGAGALGRHQPVSDADGGVHHGGDHFAGIAAAHRNITLHHAQPGDATIRSIGGSFVIVGGPHRRDAQGGRSQRQDQAEKCSFHGCVTRNPKGNSPSKGYVDEGKDVARLIATARSG